MSERYRIHPALGVARLGNSPEFFLGPEAPGRPPQGPYKDAHGRVRRQAVRFRVFAYGEDSAVREVTSQEADIKWTVHLANRKAAGLCHPPGSQLRNPSIADRKSLVTDPGPVALSGPGKAMELRGTFLGEPVRLGELQTDEKGRLIALGGSGKSGSVPHGLPCTEPANNDSWYDDVSDGWIRATVTPFGENAPRQADAAWLLVGPPDFAQPLQAVVTLYDLLEDMWEAPGPISFTRHVYPLLRRVSQMAWVSLYAARGHGPGTGGDFLEPARLARLANPATAFNKDRASILRRLVPPGGSATRLERMPMLRDTLDPERPTQDRSFTLTQRQYQALAFWARGKFEGDWPGREPEPPSLEELPPEELPKALDRAALEACLGGPFNPGLEGSYLLGLRETYRSPYRVREDLEPGALTALLAVPWQADFLGCGFKAWPSHRPTRVLRENIGWRTWCVHRSFSILRDWWKLGFVTHDEGRFVERESSLDEPTP